MKRCLKNFKENVSSIYFEAMEKSTDTIFALSENLELIYFNPAWQSFAKNNGGEPYLSTHYQIGTSITDAFSGNLNDYYKKRYRTVLKSGRVSHHQYECSSDDTFRLFDQSIRPLKNVNSLVIVNKLKIEVPYTHLSIEDHEAVEDYYVHNGVLRQCSNCRCIQRADQPDIWDRVSEWVTHMHPNTNHTMCPVCDVHYRI